MTAWDDEQREEGTLTEVRFNAEDGKGYYYVTSSNGWSCGVSAEYGVEPKVGDEFVTWGAIGRPMRGQAINGQVLWYRTPAEQEVEDAKQRDEYHARKLTEYEAKRSEYDATVAKLPEPLRKRIEDFRAFGGDAWRWANEPYELNCCEEAAKIAAHFNTGAAVQKFSKLGYEAQKKAFPAMGEGHSGNSWGFSVRLAYLLCERPDLVPMEHGALCPLVGCEDYGCYAAREKKVDAA